MSNLQRIREAYSKHLRVYVEAAGSINDAEPFCIFQLPGSDAISYAYVTFGTLAGVLHHEIVLVTCEDFPAYGDAVEAIARADQPLAPGAVVPYGIPGTPFTAMLVLPLDFEGSFPVGKGGAAPYAYRIAPLTAAERALAEREPARVFELLRAACALTADRHRICTVDLPPPPPAARTEIALERRQARAALLELQASMLRTHGLRGASMDTGASSLGFDGQRPRLGPMEPLAEAMGHMIYRALRPYAARHPASVANLFAEFLYVTLATHPDAVRMLDRIFDSRNLPAPPRLRPEQEAAAASRRVAEGVATAIVRFHSRENEAALLTHARQATLAALETFDPQDEIPIENHLWAAVLPAMYDVVWDLQPPPVRGMPRVFQKVAQKEALLEYEIDPRPALSRLRDITVRLGTQLVTAYADGLRRRVPG